MNLRRALEKVSRFDYVFLLDDSGSICCYDFTIMKMTVEETIKSLDGDNRFSIVTFHDSATVVSSFNFDKSLVIKSLQEYQRKSKYTNIFQGLKECENLHKQLRSGAQMQVILITDGNYTGTDPKDIAERLRILGIAIVVLGVGGEVMEDSAKLICNEECFYRVDNFQSLKTFMNNHGTKSSELEKGILELEIEVENQKEFPLQTSIDLPSNPHKAVRRKSKRIK